MSNSFVNFLNGAVAGSGNLRDYQHAARLYVDNFYELAPKAGWMYYVVVYVNPDIVSTITDNQRKTQFQSWLTRHRGVVGLLAKTVDLPRFTVQTETLNQYNKKTIVQKQINYTPVAISFHDDMANATTDLWKYYYQYYYADSLDSSKLSVPASIVPKYKESKYVETNNRYGLNNSQSIPFFTSIDIYQLYKQKFTSFKLVNPIIKEWAHDGMDQSQGGKLMSSRMTVEYETVIYGTPTKTRELPPGMTDTHYDRTPSPLSIGGQGTVSVLGEGGVLAGASDIFGDLMDPNKMSNPLDILNTAIKGANLARNIKKVSKEGVKEEAYSILNSTMRNIGSSDAGVINPVGTVTKVSTNDRIRGGLNQTVAGATQVINPVGINLFTGNNTGMTGTTQATPRKP